MKYFKLGPGIFVCHGDKVVVEVVNKLPATTTTIHWHGLYMKGPDKTERYILTANNISH